MERPALTYASIHRFSVRQRCVLWASSLALATAMRAVGATCQLVLRGQEHFEAVSGAGLPFVLAIWHESLALGIWRHRGAGYHTLTSHSYDGELAARVARRMGIYALRGSSSRGGAEALVQMQRAIEAGFVIGFTLDGPRGPRRQAKPGAAVLSARTGAPILPHAYIGLPVWRLRSWDRFMFPKPFSRIICAYGPPIPPPANDEPDTIEATRLRAEQALNALHAALDAEFGVDSA